MHSQILDLHNVSSLVLTLLSDITQFYIFSLSYKCLCFVLWCVFFLIFKEKALILLRREKNTKHVVSFNKILQ